MKYRGCWSKKEYATFYNNGQIKHSTLQDTIQDSLKTMTHWYKHGFKQKSVTVLHPRGGIMASKRWSFNGVLLNKVDSLGLRAFSYSDEGKLMSSSSRQGKERILTTYKADTIYSKVRKPDGVVKKAIDYSWWGDDSSSAYLVKARKLERKFRRDTDDYDLLFTQVAKYHDMAIELDPDNILAYWEKLRWHGNDIEAKLEIIEPLWQRDSTLFNCDQTWEYGAYLLRQRKNNRAIQVLTLALERWETWLVRLERIYVSRAKAYNRIGEFEKACSDINWVVEYEDLQRDGDLDQIKQQYSYIIKNCN